MNRHMGPDLVLDPTGGGRTVPLIDPGLKADFQ